jgi:hypothetical protein
MIGPHDLSCDFEYGLLQSGTGCYGLGAASQEGGEGGRGGANVDGVELPDGSDGLTGEAGSNGATPAKQGSVVADGADIYVDGDDVVPKPSPRLDCVNTASVTSVSAGSSPKLATRSSAGGLATAAGSDAPVAVTISYTLVLPETGGPKSYTRVDAFEISLKHRSTPSGVLSPIGGQLFAFVGVRYNASGDLDAISHVLLAQAPAVGSDRSAHISSASHIGDWLWNPNNPTRPGPSGAPAGFNISGEGIGPSGAQLIYNTVGDEQGHHFFFDSKYGAVDEPSRFPLDNVQISAGIPIVDGNPVVKRINQASSTLSSFNKLSGSTLNERCQTVTHAVTEVLISPTSVSPPLHDLLEKYFVAKVDFIVINHPTPAKAPPHKPHRHRPKRH